MARAWLGVAERVAGNRALCLWIANVGTRARARRTIRVCNAGGPTARNARTHAHTRRAERAPRAQD
eukprot:7044407-Lingulodinium_polyedra.AAC.1